MNITSRLASALIRLYPRAWRAEYGDEFRETLQSLPLTPAAIADVIASALGQRVRAMDTATVMGLLVMCSVLIQLSWNVVAPMPYGDAWTQVVEPSRKLLPIVAVSPLGSNLYGFFILFSTFWMSMRGRSETESAWAAVRICLIAGIPIMIAGVLIWAGALDLVIVGPADVPTTFREHGWAFTYYSAQPNPPHPFSIVVAPLFRVGETWAWGLVGGLLGRRLWKSRRRTEGS